MPPIAGLSTAARRACRSRGCSRASPRASAPTRSPRRSARASRPPTTCSSACATRASPCTTPAASTGSRRPSASAQRRRRAPELHDLSASSRSCSRAPTSAPTSRCVRDGDLRVVVERGSQGMPKLPGLEPGDPRQRARLALGKVVLALAPPEAVERYIRAGLRGFTAEHDHPSRRAARRAARGPPDRHRGRARGVRRRLLLHGRPDPRRPGPLPRRRRHLDDAAGLRRRARRRSRRRCSTSRRFQASAESSEVLDPASRPARLASTSESTVR